MFLGVWRLGGASALGDDLIYYLPIRQYIGERIRAGEFPLWNPLVSMGTPIAADPQSGLWYPPTYLFVVLPPLVAYPLTLLLHYALAGAGMYRFLRASRHDWRAAFLGAIAFEFSGYLVAHRGHLTIHHAVAWLPWILYGWRRFADTGRTLHFALAVAAFGMQMLVQHIQPSIITAALLTGYVAVVLWPKRRSLWWIYPAGMTIGVMLGGIQLLPTLLHFAGSGRGTAAYYLFIENSWVLSSAIMLLFPLFFGITSPSLWKQPWWGISHMCEQWPYASIAILLLAAASSALWRVELSGTTRTIRAATARERFSANRSLTVAALKWNREVIYWWVASLVALIIAVGDLTPASGWLFHVPFYRSLRVPARWILVWSVAMPVLASTVASAIFRGGNDAERVARRIRWIVTRALPVVVGFCFVLMLLARLASGRLSALIPAHYNQPNWSGFQRAVRLSNPALWWPMLLIIVIGDLLIRWSRTRSPRIFTWIFAICILDLAIVAAFVDVDVGTYTRADLPARPPLARAIDELKPRPGDRLLVPRTNPSYDHPLEILWPQTNMQHGMATLNGYGPLWATSNRLLLRFMAWGASEEMLAHLRNPALLRSLGVRFIAVRSPEERELMRAAMLPSLNVSELKPIAGAQEMTPIPWVDGVLWPLRIDSPGIYHLEFDAEPVAGSASRWFVRMEITPNEEIGRTRSIDPVDLSAGWRRFRFVYYFDRAIGPAFVRIKSEIGQALSAGRASFGRVGGAVESSPAASQPSAGPNSIARNASEGFMPQTLASASGSDKGSAFVHRADLPGGISLYELPGTVELVWLAEHVEHVASVTEAVDRLLLPPDPRSADRTAIVESAPEAAGSPDSGRGRISYRRAAGHQLDVDVDSASDEWLVFNESYNAGWRAKLDGDSAPLYRVNAVCQGVKVPAGRHNVQFRYYPPGLRAGMAVTAAGAFCLLFGGILSLAASRSPRRSRQV